MSTAAAAVIEGHATLRSYLAVLRGGADAYQDGRDLLPLLADDFVFEGPIAGRIAAAVLYDAELPGGAVRFSEFFEFDGGRIRQLRIQYDAADYLSKGGH